MLAHPLEVHQDEHGAELDRHLPKGVLDIGPQLGRRYLVLRSDVRWVVVLGHGAGRTALLAAQRVVTRVHGDPIQPGTEGRLSGEGPDLAEDGYESLLGGIERGLTISEHPQADSEDPVLMCIHELIEGLFVPCEEALNELGVTLGAIGHSRNRTS